MSTPPTVSVIIPTYNRAALLRHALQSVVDQTVSEWEVIVVDDHSTDDTEAVVSAFRDSRIRLIKINTHGVIAASRNLGIRNSRGEYVAFLDSDDWWTPDKLAASLASLRAGCDVVYHDMWRAKRSNQRIFFRRVSGWQLTCQPYEDMICRGNAIVNSSVVVRADLMRRIGGLSEDPELIAAEDFDCWIRLARETERFCYLSGVHGYYLSHRGNTSNARRSLVYNRRLYELYLGGRATRFGRAPTWWGYAVGRAAYLTGDHELARRQLRPIACGHASPSLRLKSAFMLCASAFGRVW